MRRNTTIIFLLVTLTISLLSGFTNAVAEIDQAYAIVYKDQNWSGGDHRVDVDTKNIGVTWASGWNNSISSIEVFGGAKVILYKDTDWTDSSETFTEHDDRIRNAIRNEVSSIRFFSPDAIVGPTTLFFGNLYLADRDGAENYNSRRTQIVKLENGTTRSDGKSLSGTTLYWEIDPATVPSYATISSSSGSLSGELSSGDSVTFTFWLNPTSTDILSNSFPAQDDRSFLIETSDTEGDGIKRIFFDATVYDTPTVTQVGPALGSNGKVNVAVNEEITFEIESGDPSFPEAIIGGYNYQWQVQPSGNLANPTAWSASSTDTQWKQSFATPGALIAYGRMMDANTDYSDISVATEPVAIPFEVWALPVVSLSPPSGSSVIGSSWFTDTYVGLVNKPMTLEATSDLVPTLSTGITALTTVSKVGTGAGNFDGNSGDTVVVTDYKGVTGTSPRTVVAWIKTSSNGTIASWGKNNAGEKWVFRVQHDDGTVGALRIGVNNGHIVGTTPVKDGVWHHVAAVLPDMATPNVTDVLLYVDGILEGTSSSDPKKIDTGNRNVWIGEAHDDKHFTGQIDDFGIFSRALTGPEILALNQPGGALTGRENGLVYFNTFDYDDSAGHYASRYLWTDQTGNTLVEQTAGSTATYTWDTQNLEGIIKAQAFTNHGIESDSQTFPLKVYPALILSSDGPFVGKPNTLVTLIGTFDEGLYPGATFSYLWSVQDTPSSSSLTDLTPSSEPEVSHNWGAVVGASGAETVIAELSVTVTTTEGLPFDASHSTTVTLDSATPTAEPGGPYRGGIAGGNFSPIQLAGNLPDVEEDTDIGVIADWDWGVQLDVDGTLENDAFIDQDYVELTSAVSNSRGQYEYTDLPLGDDFTVEGEFWSGDGTGADEFFVYLWNTNTPTGGGGAGGYAISYNEWTDAIKLNYAGTLLSDVSEADMDNSQWRTFKVEFDKGVFDIYLDDTLKLSYDDSANYYSRMSGNRFGFGARTGGSNNIHRVRNMTWVPHNIISLAGDGTYNPVVELTEAGNYIVSLRVQSEFLKWSPWAETTVTVIDGDINGKVKAADLRTPVESVTIILTSSHVDVSALNLVALNHTNIMTTSNGGLETTTDMEGNYTFPNLPLGSYTLIASKVEQDGTTIHVFEANIHVTEISLDAPNQRAIDYTDLSVFPVGGQIYYSILKYGQKVAVENVEVSAQPVGNASAIDALDSTKSLDAKSQNYSMPLFAGQYLFKARLEGHEVRLAGTQSSEGETIGSVPGYDSATQLVTIESARTDVDFVDYTTRDITVIVEDSGGFPILTNKDGNPIHVSVTGTNGADDDDVSVDSTGRTVFTTTVPPGKYTVELPNVPEAIVKGDSSQKVAEVDVTGGDGSVTMVVPVQIVISVSEAPTLLGVTGDEFDEFLADIGLTDLNLEGYMFYYAPQQQEHTYTITATANGNNVADFTLEVTDNISQITTAPAPTMTYTGADGTAYNTGTTGLNNDFVGLYTVVAGIPNATVVDESNPETYVEYDSDPNDPTNPLVKVPKVLPKTITFRASKDGYETSDLTQLDVIVLGDQPEGSVSEFVSIPSVNYLVLHDPGGDGSYSYLEDSMTVKGLLGGVTVRTKSGRKIPVYPSPWSDSRLIGEPHDSGTADTQKPNQIVGDDKDLGKQGLLGYQDPDSAVTHFSLAALGEAVIGSVVVATGSVGYVFQIAKLGATSGLFDTKEYIQYEVSPNRTLRTPIEDEIDDMPDKMGPGKGDIYYGEGWTLGLQTKYRLGIEQQTDGSWAPYTALIFTYDIMEVTNQYVYTVTDIERIISELDATLSDNGIDTGVTDPDVTDNDELKSLINARTIWKNLLEKNPAYVWRRDHIEGAGNSGRDALQTFLEDEFGDDFDDEDNDVGELLLFTGGSSFEYSRTIRESNIVEYSSEIYLGSESWFDHEARATSGFSLLGTGITFKLGSGSQATIGSAQILDKTRESGTESEQTVGFVLADGDVWDSYAVYVYKGPWGTPIFFNDPGSVTSWPWEQGTVKGIDVQMELISSEDNGPFDYRDGAHYQFKMTSIGVGVKEGSGHDFMFYDKPMGNPKSATVQFNGSDEPRYTFELFKGFSGTDLISGVEPKDGIGVASANVIVSVYPPERDWDNTEEWEYPIMVQSESIKDYQIAVNKMLRPRFADLRAPSATMTAPYDGQRISPTLFTTEGFEVEAFCDDEDAVQVQIQIRNKRPDSVYAPWQNLSGMVWEDGEANANVTIVTHTNRDPQRREFTFDWAASDISSLGVGEYQLRAVSQDAATRLSTDGLTQTAMPNVDLDAPVITFRVDDSEPTVLTTVPFYQDTESDRIYRGELSTTFTDDMNADDFSDRTFYVVDLLNDSMKVSGFVSYSPTLRKAIFVPVTPLDPNGFYKVTIKTDTLNAEGAVTEAGVHDLAGNPLDNEFSWTFRTIDSLFEETWRITLAAETTTTGGEILRDGNNIAGVETQAEDGEDEKDAAAMDSLISQIRMSFLHDDVSEYDRDIRPADGRVSHHWFIVVDHSLMSANPSQVTIKWRPSIGLTQVGRDYQFIQLVEFEADESTVRRVVSLNPELGVLDPLTGQIGVLDPLTGEFTDMVALTYTPDVDEDSRYFRLDVRKAADIVATELQRGTSGWVFFSIPITPQVANPYVNLGDDFDSLKLYDYDTAVGGYHVYPLDLDRDFGLVVGRSYFTQMEELSADVDVGGTANLNNVTTTLQDAGWHPIGNPFTTDVPVSSLLVDGNAFPGLSNEADGTLYSWLTGDQAFFKFTPVVIALVIGELNGSPPTMPQELTDAFSSNGLLLTSPSVEMIIASSVWIVWDGENAYDVEYHGADIEVNQRSDFYQAVDVNGVLKPWAGYWLKTNEDGLVLTIPVPAGHNPDEYEPPYLPPKAPPAPVAKNSFALRLALRSAFASDVITEMGTHPLADVGKDIYDTAEPPTLGQTVAAYFNHTEWADGPGLYNTDYQPPLEAGETRMWEFTVFSDRLRAEMELSWNTGGLPVDTMFFIRRKDSDESSDWMDMRKVQSIPIAEAGRITNIPFEVRVQRYSMSPPEAVQVVAGEAQVKINWKAADNPFIAGYSISRRTPDDQQPTIFSLKPGVYEFIDTDVVEEETYTYQVSVRFLTGVELPSDLFTVSVLPIIKRTALLQNYPNPFNPETWIPYELAEDAAVSLDIYSVSGQLVRSLELGIQRRGRYVSQEKSAHWDGRNEYGESVATGIYFYVLRAGRNFSATRKLVILK